LMGDEGADAEILEGGGEGNGTLFVPRGEAGDACGRSGEAMPAPGLLQGDALAPATCWTRSVPVSGTKLT
jgi:hypothetical protein